MKKSKLFESGPVPIDLLRLDNSIMHGFCVYKYEKKGSEILLYYKVKEAKGASIYAETEAFFKKISQKIEVISGGWYGKNGRWTPLEYHFGTLLCKDGSCSKSHLKREKNESVAKALNCWLRN